MKKTQKQKGVYVWNRETNLKVNSFRLPQSNPSFPPNLKSSKFELKPQRICSMNFLNEQSDSSLLLLTSDDGFVRVWSGYESEIYWGMTSWVNLVLKCHVLVFFFFDNFDSYDQPDKLQLSSAWRANSTSSMLFSAWNQGLCLAFVWNIWFFVAKVYFGHTIIIRSWSSRNWGSFWSFKVVGSRKGNVISRNSHCKWIWRHLYCKMKNILRIFFLRISFSCANIFFLSLFVVRISFCCGILFIYSLLVLRRQLINVAAKFGCVDLGMEVFELMILEFLRNILVWILIQNILIIQSIYLFPNRILLL